MIICVSLIMFCDGKNMSHLATKRQVSVSSHQPVLAEAVCLWTHQLAVHARGGRVGGVQPVLDPLSTQYAPSQHTGFQAFIHIYEDRHEDPCQHSTPRLNTVGSRLSYMCVIYTHTHEDPCQHRGVHLSKAGCM